MDPSMYVGSHDPSDYVRTAYAKGAREQRVIFLHVLRNSMIPMITNFLPLFPA